MAAGPRKARAPRKTAAARAEADAEAEVAEDVAEDGAAAPVEAEGPEPDVKVPSKALRRYRAMASVGRVHHGEVFFATEDDRVVKSGWALLLEDDSPVAPDEVAAALES